MQSVPQYIHTLKQHRNRNTSAVVGQRCKHKYLQCKETDYAELSRLNSENTVKTRKYEVEGLPNRPMLHRLHARTHARTHLLFCCTSSPIGKDELLLHLIPKIERGFGINKGPTFTLRG